MKPFLYILFVAVILITFVPDSDAQCAMCRATVESNLKEGESTVGAGLNAGILYLMSIPYIIFAVIGFLWYRSSKMNKKVSTI